VAWSGRGLGSARGLQRAGLRDCAGAWCASGLGAAGAWGDRGLGRGGGDERGGDRGGAAAAQRDGAAAAARAPASFFLSPSIASPRTELRSSSALGHNSGHHQPSLPNSRHPCLPTLRISTPESPGQAPASPSTGIMGFPSSQCRRLLGARPHRRRPPPVNPRPNKVLKLVRLGSLVPVLPFVSPEIGSSRRSASCAAAALWLGIAARRWPHPAKAWPGEQAPWLRLASLILPMPSPLASG
jgi:hypothetical protein